MLVRPALPDDAERMMQVLAQAAEERIYVGTEPPVDVPGQHGICASGWPHGLRTGAPSPCTRRPASASRAWRRRDHYVRADGSVRSTLVMALFM